MNFNPNFFPDNRDRVLYSYLTRKFPGEGKKLVGSRTDLGDFSVKRETWFKTSFLMCSPTPSEFFPTK